MFSLAVGSGLAYIGRENTGGYLFWGITDRGPNADFDGIAGKGKQFLVPNYTPSIGLFELQADGKIIKVKEIILHKI